MPTFIDLPEKIVAGLTESTKEVFADVSKLDCIKDLFLCGGTGQSIQMNHRLSEDLDFELIGLRKERPQLDFVAILGELKAKFPDAREEILGEDHLQVFINGGKVKLSFFRSENPVKSMSVGVQFNNLKAPVLQELLGMKVFALCVRTVFRDYYDIYCPPVPDTRSRNPGGKSRTSPRPVAEGATPGPGPWKGERRWYSRTR